MNVMGIAVVPTTDAVKRAIALQQAVGNSGNVSLEPTLSSSENLPHISLYQGPFKADTTAAEILDRVRRALPTQTGALSAESVGLTHQPVGWVFVSFSRDVFQGLQAAALSVVRSRLETSDIDMDKDVSGYTRAEAKNYFEWGYRYIGDQFAPHITIGRSSDEVARRLTAEFDSGNITGMTWSFDRLTIYQLGPNGSHARTLAEAPLAT